MSTQEPLLLDGEKEQDMLGLEDDEFSHAEPLHARSSANVDTNGAGEHYSIDLPPDLLFADEATQWDAVPAMNLDKFLRRVYDYYLERGFACILVSRVLNLLTLAFTIWFSGFLLLFVNWTALLNRCNDTHAGEPCELLEDAVLPKASIGIIKVVYLIIFVAYWVWTFVRFILDLPGLLEIRNFCQMKLGISESELQCMRWPEVVDRMVTLQKKSRFCIVKDLTALDIVCRIMRKENYFIGMMNKRVIDLHIPIPGLRRHQLLTQTVEWNIYWCVLNCMFDEHFRIDKSFLNNERALRRRMMISGVLNLFLSPFMLIFMSVYFFLRDAEHFYNQPSAIGARQWSSKAKWEIREFNELPHMLSHRLNGSYKSAEKYVKQFPSYIFSMVGKFVAFVVGGFAAVLLFLALVEETLLEAQVYGRHLVWYAAIFGGILAVSRSLIVQEGLVFRPGAIMHDIAYYTHFLPKHWRGKCHTQKVRLEFEEMFQFKIVLFMQEMISIFVVPFMLWYSLPRCAPDIIAFVNDFTVHIDGMGHLCSLSVFDFERHGNSHYGAVFNAGRKMRSAQGKMEKSFLTFRGNYPQWKESAHGAQLVRNLAAYSGLAATSVGSPVDVIRFSRPDLRSGFGARSTDSWGTHIPAHHHETSSVSRAAPVIGHSVPHIPPPPNPADSFEASEADIEVASSQECLQHHYDATVMPQQRQSRSSTSSRGQPRRLHTIRTSIYEDL